MRLLSLGVVLVVLLAAPAAAHAVSVLRVTEHVVPASASTGELVQARVTVTNVGDTPTEATTEVEWDAIDDQGGIIADFVMRPPVCPPGAEGLGPGSPCLISTPIAAGASVTALFSGSSRRAAVIVARARVVDGGTGLSDHHTKALSITGPTLPEPAGPRISRLTLEDRRLRPGQRARLRFTLDRRAKTLHTSLWRCRGRTGCRRAQFVPSSTITTRGRRGPNRLAYSLPARLAPGRYRLTVWPYEAFHRLFARSVTFRVLPRRR